MRTVSIWLAGLNPDRGDPSFVVAINQDGTLAGVATGSSRPWEVCQIDAKCTNYGDILADQSGSLRVQIGEPL